MAFAVVPSNAAHAVTSAYDFPVVDSSVNASSTAACIANSWAVADDYRPFLGGAELSVICNSVEVPALEDKPLRDIPWRYYDAIRCAVVGTMAPGKGKENAVMKWCVCP